MMCAYPSASMSRYNGCVDGEKRRILFNFDINCLSETFTTVSAGNLRNLR